MAKRVFELARELGVTSKVVLVKCRAEGLEIKNHMSTLSAGLEATVYEWFSEEGGTGTAVETTEHVDLATARNEASKRKRRKTKKDEVEQPATEAAEQQPAEAEEDTTPAEEPVALAPDEAEAQGEPAEAIEAPPEVVEGEQQPEKKAAEAKNKRAKDRKKADLEPAQPPKPEQVTSPAGPQVVPKPAALIGPRVVRVEKPDDIRPFRARRPSAPAGLRTGGAELGSPPKIGARGGEGGEGGETGGRKKTKRRSPRRRSGRTADSGDRIKEWRNQDLIERSERLAAAGGGLRRRRPGVSGRMANISAGAKIGKVEIDEPITVKNLSAATGVKVADILKRMLGLGVMATVNQILDKDTAEAVMADYEIELVIKASKSPAEEMLEKLLSRETGRATPRPPVVTFLGHVDHGKTSLMDRIRNTGVAKGEAGGITQHIGAYRLDQEGSSAVVFMDTPGHEAFTAMRARGANMTDVVVLVVAADDGVMPQTVEAISHAKAAEVPIIVALNKIDVPNANIQRALGQLAEHGLQAREWGGDVEVIQTSAETGEGVETLVETLGLEAELLELTAEVDAPSRGYVIEAEMNPGLGVLARLLVLNGTLKVGDMLLAGKGYGRVRSIRDDHGRNITEAGPATPVEVAGLDEIPEAGDEFYVVEDIEQARAVAEQCRQDARVKELATVPKKGLESLLSQIEAGRTNELPVILKADVQGSIEAIAGSIEKLGTEETRVKILHSAVGGISTGDVMLAEASDAMIIGFNVVPDSSGRQMAKEKGIDIRLYRVIYDLIEDIRRALEQGLAPEIREEALGRAEVRQVFKVSRIGTIAGCLATDGVVQRNAKVRIIRDQVVIEDDRSLESLKRFKDDAREVRAGLECGLKIAGYDDIKEGDILEFYQQVEVARTL